MRVLLLGGGGRRAGGADPVAEQHEEGSEDGVYREHEEGERGHGTLGTLGVAIRVILSTLDEEREHQQHLVAHDKHHTGKHANRVRRLEMAHEVGSRHGDHYEEKRAPGSCEGGDAVVMAMTHVRHRNTHHEEGDEEKHERGQPRVSDDFLRGLVQHIEHIHVSNDRVFEERLM
eukprot:CAMPEP_0114424058 /NCGR_PEP_ID=MMETSP0103-20121206/6486_1 /TAXON_ID=37642 ORGANISM="Paraphysomonas imperforata, Strain PA2" /NCGR_SAMPLE_ID=MMETSP0103 /ASSEMBLY_ACC=CAM_ASM_000201 /LENGTH=173 /DNA_ID=CAMNT_0001592775 /DNA_START=245 /DNA_END=766 /DNA_ORIENTATION=+